MFGIASQAQTQELGYAFLRSAADAIPARLAGLHFSFLLRSGLICGGYVRFKQFADNLIVQHTSDPYASPRAPRRNAALPPLFRRAALFEAPNLTLF